MRAESEESVSLDALNQRRAAAPTPTPTPSTAADVSGGAQQPVAEAAQLDDMSEQQKEIARLRAAEKFITVDEGRFECAACSYVYEPSQGERQSGIAAGTAFADLPNTYFCPVCRTPKGRFIAKKKVIAGFADNQSYGFGTNSMTGGQKNALIFGGLLLAFLLLLSGYALN